MATNLLTNSDFASGLTGWTTGTPIAEAGRTYTVSGGSSVLTTVGLAAASLSQLVTVTAGASYVVGFRAACNVVGMPLRFGLWDPATSIYLPVVQSTAAVPLAGVWPVQQQVVWGRCVIPAATTSVRFVVEFGAGTAWVDNCYMLADPDLTVGGDFSVVDAAGIPAGWVQDTGTGVWATAGGAMSLVGTGTVMAAAQTVTAGEVLRLSGLFWGSAVGALFSCAVKWSDGTYTSPQPAGTAPMLAQTDYSEFVVVPAAVTTGRVVVGGATGAATAFFDKLSLRRTSTVTIPVPRVELGFGVASDEDSRPGVTTWTFDDAGPRGQFDTMSFGAGGSIETLTWTDVSAYVYAVDWKRGRNTAVDEYEAASGTIQLDNTDGRFHPLNTTGPYAVSGVSYVKAGIGARISLVDPETWEPRAQLTGRVRAFPIADQFPGTSLVTIQIVDLTEALNVLGPVVAVTVGPQLSHLSIGAILDAAAWPASQRVLDVGATTMQQISYVGSALSACRGVAASEPGRLYLDGSGRVRFRAATSAQYRNLTSQLILAPGGAWNYHARDAIADDDLVRNRIEATRVGGVIQLAVDPAADQSTVRAYRRSDLQLPSDVAVLAWANTVLAASTALPSARVSSVTFNEAAPGMWPLLLWTELGDRYTVGHYTAGLAGRFDQALIVERVTARLTPTAVAASTVQFGFVPA